MNNEPVAWINREEGSGFILDWEKDPYSDTNIPLYTHPAKELDKQFKKGFEAGKEEGWKAHKFHHLAKTLTDEEITYLAKRFEGVWNGEVDYKGFAKAILRKAQEK